MNDFATRISRLANLEELYNNIAADVSEKDAASKTKSIPEPLVKPEFEIYWLTEDEERAKEFVRKCGVLRHNLIMQKRCYKHVLRLFKKEEPEVVVMVAMDAVDFVARRAFIEWLATRDDVEKAIKALWPWKEDRKHLLFRQHWSNMIKSKSLVPADVYHLAVKTGRKDKELLQHFQAMMDNNARFLLGDASCPAYYNSLDRMVEELDDIHEAFAVIKKIVELWTHPVWIGKTRTPPLYSVVTVMQCWIDCAYGYFAEYLTDKVYDIVINDAINQIYGPLVNLVHLINIRRNGTPSPNPEIHLESKTYRAIMAAIRRLFAEFTLTGNLSTSVNKALALADQLKPEQIHPTSRMLLCKLKICPTCVNVMIKDRMMFRHDHAVEIFKCMVNNHDETRHMKFPPEFPPTAAYLRSVGKLPDEPYWKVAYPIPFKK